MPQDFAKTVFNRVTRDAGTSGGLDKDAQQAEPGNFLRHIAALSGSKLADGLIDPKLVLSWLLTHLGAGSFWVGLLVPVRESGALLPQLFTTPYIAASPYRKWFWAGGSAVQGVCAGGIAVAGLTLQGAVAGAVIVTLLGVLALARSVCSASYKDVLGKTVGKSRRGTATGFASSVAAVGVIAFALVLLLDLGGSRGHRDRRAATGGGVLADCRGGDGGAQRASVPARGCKWHRVAPVPSACAPIHSCCVLSQCAACWWAPRLRRRISCCCALIAR